MPRWRTRNHTYPQNFTLESSQRPFPDKQRKRDPMSSALLAKPEDLQIILCCLFLKPICYCKNICEVEPPVYFLTLAQVRENIQQNNAWVTNNMQNSILLFQVPEILQKFKVVLTRSQWELLGHIFEYSRENYSGIVRIKKLTWLCNRSCISYTYLLTLTKSMVASP